MQFSRLAVLAAASISLLSTPATAQTTSDCNPRFTTCPADPALGRAISVDFTQGAVDSFTPQSNPTYEADGVHFTVAAGGQAPQLVSRFYIMFGKVSLTMKAAPGAGIVSSVVLQSDTLDEIDFEWLGAASTEVQSNYFGKGDVTTYNRGAFHETTENQQEFVTYDIEWTATQIIWSVGGSVVRILTPETADTNQYPQTPMQVKFGSWSGGDPANPQGTIDWSRGPTDYSKGPFNMIVKSISITDYSTGTSYEYKGNSGNMADIVAVDGEIGADKGATATSNEAPAVTSLSPSVPAGLGSSDDNGSPTVAVEGVPSGWVVSSNGKIVPINSGSACKPSIVGVACGVVFAVAAACIGEWLPAIAKAAMWQVTGSTQRTEENAPECLNSDLILNATNIEALVNCTLYTYQCPFEKVPSGEDRIYNTTYSTIPPPAAANCSKGNFSLFFTDESITGPFVVPRLLEAEHVSFRGYTRRVPEDEDPISLAVESIEFPDLVNVTQWGVSISFANNVSSIKFPKLERAKWLNFDLSGGPGVNLSFPNLIATDAHGISLTGNIDALEFPHLKDANKINIASTGNLDCVAFAASVVNATGTWWPGQDEVPM
ncbi:hypothetical protein V490_01000, partial [Pseudogymnoascus sp. VKM F-3557]